MLTFKIRIVKLTDLHLGIEILRIPLELWILKLLGFYEEVYFASMFFK